MCLVAPSCSAASRCASSSSSAAAAAAAAAWVRARAACSPASAAAMQKLACRWSKLLHTILSLDMSLLRKSGRGGRGAAVLLSVRWACSVCAVVESVWEGAAGVAATAGAAAASSQDAEEAAAPASPRLPADAARAARAGSQVDYRCRGQNRAARQHHRTIAPAIASQLTYDASEDPERCVGVLRVGWGGAARLLSLDWVALGGDALQHGEESIQASMLRSLAMPFMGISRTDVGRE